LFRTQERTPAPPYPPTRNNLAIAICDIKLEDAMRLTRKEVLDKLPPKTREEIDRENKAGEITFEYARKAARDALEGAVKSAQSGQTP
jgi:hypothetical protein